MFLKRYLTAILVVFCFSSVSVFAEKSRDREIMVMTCNMYPGTDFGEIFAAQTQAEVFAEVAEAFGDVQASNVPERIDKIADQIEAARPVVIALQEVALWRTGPVFDPGPATNVAFDYLQLLLDELSSRGLSYSAIAVQSNFDAEVPGYAPPFALDVRFTDRVVTLARTDLAVSQFKLEGTQTSVFDTILTIPTPAMGNITIPRGWTSVDVKMRGKGYRFINAHLESFHPLVQYAQGAELLQGPGGTSRTTVMAGDFNSDAETGGATYQLLRNGGYSDVWETLYPNDPGFTWPLFLVSPSVYTNPFERLDLVLIRGAVRATSAEVHGENPLTDRTPSGLMMSDHAALSAGLVLEP